MRLLKNKSKQKIALMIILGFIISSTPFTYLFFRSNFPKVANTNTEKATLNPQGIVEDFYSVQWLDNPTFESPVDPWYNSTFGDTSDLIASIGTNQANYEVLGDEHTEQILLDSSTYSNWEPFNKSELVVVPQRNSVPYYGVDSDGAWCSHRWDEGESGGQPKNTPEMHWKTNVSLSVDMSDYIITSVDFEAIINGSVEWYVDTPGDSYARPTTVAINQYSKYDFAQFYVEISTLDVDELNTYRIAFNQTLYLGNEARSLYDIEGLIGEFGDQAIINAITNVLSVDPGHNNFTVILGIYIYCEDNNSGTDLDDWLDLRFKYLNLTFTYEKKIDQSAALSWDQVGNKITGTNIDIINATLNFKYKLDQNWTDSSPNSEFRILINNRQHTETIKLSNGNSTFQDIKVGGLDVTTLILKNTNITVSIQVYIADTFALGQKITISITNATLDISYKESTVEDVTSLDLFLNQENKTLEQSIEVKWGTTVNITVRYKDSLNDFIPGALVQLTPSGPINLTENVGLQQYNITLNTRDMILGNNYFQIYANKRYYEDILIQLNIKVLEKDTDIELFLDEQDKTLDKAVQMIYGNDGNITITYQDIEELPAVYIDSAVVQLEGLGAPRNLSQVSNRYTIIINTAELGLGNSFLTVIAQKENYTTQSIRFKIEVLERNSYIDKINLNGVEQTTIELQWAENLNVAITYNDSSTGAFILGASVQLSGTGISENFIENADDYSLVINTNQLKIGINFLTISAFKENFTLASRIVSISVTERATYIDEILLNHLDRTENKTITITADELLNITFKYKDSTTNNPLTGAGASIQSSYYSDNMTENLLTNQYSIEFNSSVLGVGAKFLNIIASLENHSISSEVLTIFIVERGSILDVKLNGTKYPNNYITVEVWQTINITVTFKDLITTNHLANATIDLLGFGEFLEDETRQQYTYIVDAADLDQGIDILNLVAKKSAYLSQAAQITVEITERKTRFDLFINGLNSTIDPYLLVPIGSKVNFSITYIDSSDLFVSGATVNLVGENLDKSLSEDSTNEVYSYSLNTRELDIGVRILTIVAQRNNYQIQTIDIRLDVRRINTNITSSTGSSVINTTPGSTITLSVIITDLDFNQLITNATVSYRWEGESGTLTYHNGKYQADVPNIPIGSHTFTITAFAGDDYDFQRYEITVTAVQSPVERGLFILLLTLALIAAGALGIYIVLYQTYLKYPKAVRKVRKYRKTLNKEREPNVDITSRESATKSIYHSEYDKSSKFLKGKPVPKQSIEAAEIKKTPIE